MTQYNNSSARSRSGQLEELISRAAADIDPSIRAIFEAFARQTLVRLKSVRSIILPDETLAAITLATFRLLEQRTPGPARININEVSLPAGGTHDEMLRVPQNLTVLTIINDDKPFLVSSVMGEIQARGLKTFLVLHPIYEARRDGTNRLIAFEPQGDSTQHKGEPDWKTESVIVAVTEPLDDAATQDLSKALRGILDQVDAAVRDWKPMIERLDRAVAMLEEKNRGKHDSIVAETIAFCKWMRQGQFIFLGMREYHLDGGPEKGLLRVIEGSGRGVLADSEIHVLRRGRELVSLNEEIRRFYLKPYPIIITKSNVQSVVHRRAHMDYVGIKIYAEDGSLTGELRIVGLFTAAAYTEPPTEIPFLRLKVARIFEETGIKRSSHEGRMLQNILDTFPRDELIQIGVHQLASWVPTILQLEFEPRIRAFVRRDRFDRFVSIIIFIPRDGVSTKVREDIAAMLADVYRGRTVIQQPFFTPGPLVRVHFIIGRYEGATPKVDEAELERRIASISETWQDRLGEQLAAMPAKARRFVDAFPVAYAESFTPERALEDIERIERLSDATPLVIDFYRAPDAPPTEIRAAIYCFDKPIPLSDRVPVLENLGFAVIDERTYRISPRWNNGGRSVCLHDMVLELVDRESIELGDVEVALEAAFVAVFSGRADNDSFNRLVMVAGADWREAAMLRSYAAYMRQIALPYDRTSVAETLAHHPSRAVDLIAFFKARFDPSLDASEADRSGVEAGMTKSFDKHLADVPSLDEDRILRTLWGLIAATLRTNFFLTDEAGEPPQVQAFKLSSRNIADAPEPRPYREIWVSGPQVDGVHLRFAPIARGGLRWSDRAHDFRTEVLGLAKAQQVKNTVIVPQGAKGGFVPKQLPKDGTREELLSAGVAAYRTFITTLLSMTDNLVDGSIVPPQGIVRRDEDDPYLVVAADKGTATFSDYANAISQARGFWLGDAFASGGSAGYDHKKMGITARGAWEGVKRHFREMDRDIQAEPFTVAGVGDMSGDVFGNGMLLSRHIRLVAAFDHRDIFIDPEPDAKTSFAERKRLFQLPRSSWQDYDKTLLSQGGGIFSRSAKSVQLSPEIRALLGLDKETATPAEIIRSILKAKVELFWFGGIGTYVRGDHESNADVGDRGNDAIRVTSSEFGARVVGEGANLGVTQDARVDFALRGGRINTDFIDNSAGVNSSDQEVNIKVALAPAVASGRLDMEARNVLLVQMTEDIASACLVNNYEQTLALSLAERRGPEGMADALHLMHDLEKRDLLDRDLENLPSDALLKERREGGLGLMRPELAILMSYAKIALSYDLNASTVPDDPAVSGELDAYFPGALRKSYADFIAAHPLRREIITTRLSNQIINIAGLDLPSRLADDWDLDAVGVAHALIAALAVTSTDSLFAAIGAEDNRIEGNLQLGLYGEAQRQLRNRAAWQGAEHRSMPSLTDTISRHAHAYQTLALAIGDWLSPVRTVAMEQAAQSWISSGAPPTIATALAHGAVLAEAGDICLVTEAVAADLKRDPRGQAEGRELLAVAVAYVAIGDGLRLSVLKERGREVEAADRFDRLAINDALASLASSHRKMTRSAMRGDASKRAGAATVAAWRNDPAGPMTRVAQRLSELIDSGPLSVARLTVAAGLIRDLAEALSRDPGT